MEAIELLRDSISRDCTVESLRERLFYVVNQLESVIKEKAELQHELSAVRAELAEAQQQLHSQVATKSQEGGIEQLID